MPVPAAKVSTPLTTSRPRNAILAQLPADEYAALAKSLVPVDLPLEKRLSEPNRPIEFVYFLNSGLISTDAITERRLLAIFVVVWSPVSVPGVTAPFAPVVTACWEFM